MLSDLDADMQANRSDFPAHPFPMYAAQSGARFSSEIWPYIYKSAGRLAGRKCMDCA